MILSLSLGFMILIGGQYLALWLGGKLINPVPRSPVVPLSTIIGIQFIPLLAIVAIISAASNSLRGKTLRDIIAIEKQSNKLAVGHGGNGTLMHLTSEMFNQMAETRLELVPYRAWRRWSPT
jgi:tripartite-type tricarboxylate transporter receptor subunit TctC